MGSFVHPRKGTIMKALLSVYDKAGIVEFARKLDSLGVEIISSGGTAKALRVAEPPVPVTDVAELTGVPAILGHRVVTLHPKVHGGILADRFNPEHVADMEKYGIEGIDLVVVNLYPFSSDPSIELIDIGGPAMVRAAAKNHAHVAVVVDPVDYDDLLSEVEHCMKTGGSLNPNLCRRLARKAFATTAAYDAQIVQWLDDDDPLPPTIHLALEKVGEPLRYGENPHQQGARYREIGKLTWLDEVEMVAGNMALSYLNLYDAAAAWVLCHDLGDQPCVAIIKHANPCGVAISSSLAEAYQLAFSCDERSAFGGIVALNRVVDKETVESMVAAAQADVVIAPGYDDGVVEALQKKRKNTRLLKATPPKPDSIDLRQINGGWLVQEPHHFPSTRADWQVVTQRQPTEAEWADAELAHRVNGRVKSNSIVLVKGGVVWGIGAGQQNRIESTEIATNKAASRAAGGALGSDAFFPFRDGIEAAALSGAAVIIQPGGAQRDEDNIACADELGIAMVFTGERHFFH